MKTHAGSIIQYFHTIVLLSLFSTIFIYVIPVEIEAQDITERPSVGLVLSGGGAHGIAHLGVIKVMEEAGLRPDYMTGVSMGSIIGGFYSLGYSADSLYKILKQIDWGPIFSNKIPENKVIFLEKDYFDNSIISLPLSNNKVKLPLGIINGQQIENMLSFYAWPAADINDFSRLPVPFVCLGTDIITYKKVILNKGYLADAIRASSSVPSIFTPLKIDTLLLLDGGLIRNFAASEIKDMGADIVIGSYAGFEAYKEEELQSVSGIIKQIAMSRSLEDFEKQKKLVDLLITPKTDKFPLSGFENVDSLVAKGYEAALPYKKYFKNLSDSLNMMGLQKPLENILDKQSYTFNKIEITGNKTYSDSQIRGVLDIEPGEKIDKYLLSDKIELLYGKVWFDKVKYRIVPRNDSLILVIDCIEAPRAMLYGSVHYDNSLLAGLILGISLKNLVTQRSVIKMNSYIGQYYRFKLNTIQFIDKNQKYGLSADFYADNTLIPMMEIKGNRVDVVNRNFIPGLSINRRFGLNHLMGVSATIENTYLLPHNSTDIHLQSLTYKYLSGSYDYQINTINTKHFPDHGTIFNLSVSSSKLMSATVKTDSSKTVLKEDNNGGFSFDRFITLYGHIQHYFTSVEKMTFEISGDALLITHTDSVSAQNNFYLMGGVESVNKRSVPLVGFHSNEIPITKMAGIRTELDIELFDNFHFSLLANIAAVQVVNNNNEFSLLTGYGIGVGYMSIIGPLKIGIMQGNYKQEDYFSKIKGYISLGYKF